MCPRVVHQCYKSYKCYKLSSRVVSDWNSLPEDVIHAETVNAFKNSLDDYFSNDPSVFDYDM